MNELTEVRTPEVVGAEIRNLSSAAKYMTVWYAVEIGRRLTEAKSLVKHGEWLAWLQRETEFSQPSASRLMRIYAEYGADQGSLFGAETKYSTLNNLSVSNALRLLAVPEEERESFANEVDAEHLSTRELETAIRERDEAIRRAESARKDAEDMEKLMQKSADELSDALSALEDKESEAELADREIETLKEQVRQLEARPVEVAVQEPDPAALQKAVDAALEESRAKHAAELEKLQKKLESAEKARDKAREAAEKAGEKATEAGKAEAEKLRTEQQTAAAEAQRYKAEAEALKKKLAMSGEAVTTFKLHFTAWQRAYADMMTALDAADGEAAAKLRAAVAAQLGAWGKETEG